MISNAVQFWIPIRCLSCAEVPVADPEAEEEEAALEDLEVEVESAVVDAPDASIFPEVGQVNLEASCRLSWYSALNLVANQSSLPVASC